VFFFFFLNVKVNESWLMSNWRLLGLSYIRYTNLCASYVRSAVKEEFRGKIADRDARNINLLAWTAGNPTNVTIKRDL